MRRNTWIVLAGIVVFGAAGLLWHGSAGAQIASLPVTGIGHRLAGTYYTQEWPGTSGPMNVVWTMTEDGTIVSDTGVDQGVEGFIWGNVRGSWIQIGPRTIQVTGLGLGFDPAAGGAHVYTVKVHAVFTFDAGFQNASAQQYNELYLADQNPLDPGEVPVWAGDLPRYEFQRLNVAPPQ